MITRAAKRLKTNLLSSRQSLPRPARLYSTPTKKSNAPAVATQQAPQSTFPSFLAKEDGADTPSHNFPADMELFLQTPPRYTVLPAPVPIQRPTQKNATWLTDSMTQDSLAVMDACLYQSFDVPRAKGIFERLRREATGTHILDVRMYNAFLEAYIDMAKSKASDNRDFWIECAWELFDNMESGREKVEPSAGSYATMLLAWMQ
jgi:DNA-directed RNA polymerase